MENIASQVGYRSEAAFSRAFRRELDLSPGMFRKTRKLDSVKEHTGMYND